MGVSKVTVWLIVVVVVAFAALFGRLWWQSNKIGTTMQANSSLQSLNDFVDLIHQQVVDNQYVHPAGATKQGAVARSDFGLGDARAARSTAECQYEFRSQPSLFGQQKFTLICTPEGEASWAELTQLLLDEASVVFPMIDARTCGSVIAQAVAPHEAAAGQPGDLGSTLSEPAALPPLINWHQVEVAARAQRVSTTDVAGDVAGDVAADSSAAAESQAAGARPQVELLVTVSKL